MTSERYYDAADQPIANADGEHGWIREYDEHGYPTMSARTDINHKPIPNAEGIGFTRWYYNSAGRVHGFRHFDVDGHPTVDRDGVHGLMGMDFRGEEGAQRKRMFGVDGRDLRDFSEVGAHVFELLPESDAERSGLAVHDIILQYDGRRVKTDFDLSRFIEELSQDESVDTVEVVVERGGEQLTLQIEKLLLGAGFGTQYVSPRVREINPDLNKKLRDRDEADSGAVSPPLR